MRPVEERCGICGNDHRSYLTVIGFREGRHAGRLACRGCGATLDDNDVWQPAEMIRSGAKLRVTRWFSRGRELNAINPSTSWWDVFVLALLSVIVSLLEGPRAPNGGSK